MAKKVQNSDLFSADLFKRTQEDIKLLISELDSLDKKIISVAQSQKQILSQQDNKTLKSVQNTKTAIDKLNEAERVAVKVRQEKLKLEQKLTQGRKKQSQDKKTPN